MSHLSLSTARHPASSEPGRIQTCDLEVRSLLLYFAELRAQVAPAGFEPTTSGLKNQRPSQLVRGAVTPIFNYFSHFQWFPISLIGAGPCDQYPMGIMDIDCT